MDNVIKTHDANDHLIFKVQGKYFSATITRLTTWRTTVYELDGCCVETIDYQYLVHAVDLLVKDYFLKLNINDFNY
jgi:hypothetical protein